MVSYEATLIDVCSITHSVGVCDEQLTHSTELSLSSTPRRRRVVRDLRFQFHMSSIKSLESTVAFISDNTLSDVLSMKLILNSIFDERE